MKVFIIGIDGRVAQRHSKAWKELNYAVYGCDQSADYRKVIGEGEYDIIDICTPIFLHVPMIKEVARRGYDIICEKPLSLPGEDVSDILNLPNKIGIIYQFRYNPILMMLREAIRGGEYGDVKLIKLDYFRWRGWDYYKSWEHKKNLSGGGALYNVNIHWFDMFQWLMGYPTSISGYITSSKQGLDVEDIGSVTMKFPSGAVGSMTFSTDTQEQRHTKLYIQGTKKSEEFEVRQNEYHKENFQAFIDGVNYVTPREALLSINMIKKVYENSR